MPILVLSLFSCEKKLDLNPLDQYASNVFWTSENNAKLALTALYKGNIQMIDGAEFSPTDWWSYNGLIFLEFATDNAYDRRGDNSPVNQLTSGALTSNNGLLPPYWSNSFSRIAKCNYFLENIGKAVISDSVKNGMIAEAKFLRASQYLYLSTYFGSVPLVTKTLTLQEANTVDKAPLKTVQDFVETEYIAAAANLPIAGNLPASDRGRATRQADLAFLGRLYLTQQNWSKAADTYKQIIDLNNNIIDPDYASLFIGTNENSKEIIFATQYVVDLAPNAMMQHFYPRMSGGWSIFCPLASLAESYDFQDGTPFSYDNPEYDPADIAKNRDPRFKYNIMYNNELFKGQIYTSNPDQSSAVDKLTLTLQATRTGYNMMKYNYANFSGGDLQNSGIDLPIIRYSEVLLSYLEAEINLGIVNQNLLDATINKVRGRASVNMPAITETDPVKLMTILKKERRNELAFEGIRLWDLYRWNDAAKVLEGNFFGASFPGAINLRKAPDGSTDPYSRWFVTNKKFAVGNYPWPIPQSEVNINPKLK